MIDIFINVKVVKVLKLIKVIVVFKLMNIFKNEKVVISKIFIMGVLNVGWIYENIFWGSMDLWFKVYKKWVMFVIEEIFWVKVVIINIVINRLFKRFLFINFIRV